jgi:hypothetical protein
VRRAPAAALALGLLAALGAAAGAAESAIDSGAVDNPQSLILGDGRAQARWQALFELHTDWVSRQIAFLGWRLPEKFATLLSARLLYHGDPWTRRDYDSTNERQWRVSDLETRSEILREIRWLRDPALIPVLELFLERETEPSLVKSALVDLWLLAPKDAPLYGLRLGDPRKDQRLPASSLPAPASSLPANRQNALSFLFDVCGPASPQARQVLDWALLRATGAERNHGISTMPRGSFPDVLKPCIIQLAEERRRGELDDEGREGLVLASSRLGADIDPELATALVEIAVNGTREIATAAATALAINVSWQTSVPIAPISQRAGSDPDPVVRFALLNLLLRLNPEAAQASSARDSPWRALAAHRIRLRKWEWEQDVK